MNRRFASGLLARGVGGLLGAAGLPRAAASAAAPLPDVDVGRLERLPSLGPPWVDARPVDVWLPPDHDARVRAGQRLPVLYMQDGQMLFDARTTWNHQAWDVHRTVARLIAQQRLPPVLVVGVWNNGPLRHSEYFPQKFLDHMAPAPRREQIEQRLAGQPRSDAYLRFLVEGLKPAIDARYATATGPEHTAIMGSSMGGLISLYALCEYPRVFGAAACLSTHWVGSYQPNAAIPLAAFNYLRDHLAAPAGHRLYMDHGTLGLDAMYAPYQRFVDQIVRDAGYDASNSATRVFEGQGHDERAWASRLEIPLRFLFGSA
jgi:enterochelin esterase-like enzyme